MQNISYREILSAIAIMLTFAAFIPYILKIFKGETRPHVFSWVIWGSTTIVVFFAQIEGKGGVGAWPIGVSGTITMFIALLAYVKRGDISITKTDWTFFIAALASLPLWYLTSNPLWAVIILTTVDLLGFGPTIRKAYSSPLSESMLFFAIFAVRNLLVIMALETHSLTTVLFPAVISVACMAVIVILANQRRILHA